MPNRYMMRCSKVLIIKEIQVKTTMKYYLIPVKSGYHKKMQEKTSVVEDVKKRKPLCVVDGNVNW